MSLEFVCVSRLGVCEIIQERYKPFQKRGRTIPLHCSKAHPYTVSYLQLSLGLGKYGGLALKSTPPGSTPLLKGEATISFSLSVTELQLPL